MGYLKSHLTEGVELDKYIISKTTNELKFLRWVVVRGGGGLFELPARILNSQCEQ